jgi:hypothetical protein
MTYVCPAWEFAADSHTLKFQRLESKVFRTTDNSPRRTPTHDLHVSKNKVKAVSDVLGE